MGRRLLKTKVVNNEDFEDIMEQGAVSGAEREEVSWNKSSHLMALGGHAGKSRTKLEDQLCWG